MTLSPRLLFSFGKGLYAVLPKASLFGQILKMALPKRLSPSASLPKQYCFM